MHSIQCRRYVAFSWIVFPSIFEEPAKKRVMSKLRLRDKVLNPNISTKPYHRLYIRYPAIYSIPTNSTQDSMPIYFGDDTTDRGTVGLGQVLYPGSMSSAGDKWLEVKFILVFNGIKIIARHDTDVNISLFTKIKKKTFSHLLQAENMNLKIGRGPEQTYSTRNGYPY